MKSCFGYVRVSTQKQGEGVSLDAQRDAIFAFAARNNITITEWFEEKETAAKSGRPIFLSMMKQLMRRKAEGVVLHKVDRGARNLADWAKFAELADNGIDVHFATETLDFKSRGGRLTADIQAVIAADYIRNLREETLKGMVGRLKQGIYPFGAPLGYQNNGKGKVKTIDPVKGPLVKRLFELYASGQHSLHSLVPISHTLGLRNNRGNLITKSGVEKILQNPFYCGLMRVKTMHMTYRGSHEPLISASLFETVQAVRAGKSGKKITKHLHTYRGLFACGVCGSAMIAEVQKGYVYYRCHTSGCDTKTIREEQLEGSIASTLHHASLDAVSEDITDECMAVWFEAHLKADDTAPLRLRLAQVEERLERLMDALIDRLIDGESYAERKHALLIEQVSLEEKLNAASSRSNDPEHLRAFLELMKTLPQLYEAAEKDEKRQIVELATSNRTVCGRNVCVEPADWLMVEPKAVAVSEGDPRHTTPRSSPDLISERIDVLLRAATSEETRKLKQIRTNCG
jgi:site-specific DNA recombinase